MRLRVGLMQGEVRTLRPASIASRSSSGSTCNVWRHLCAALRCVSAACAGLRVREGVGQGITYLYAAILLHLVLLLAHRVEKVVPNSVPHRPIFASSCRVTELCHSTVEAVSHSGH